MDLDFGLSVTASALALRLPQLDGVFHGEDYDHHSDQEAHRHQTFKTHHYPHPQRNSDCHGEVFQPRLALRAAQQQGSTLPQPKLDANNDAISSSYQPHHRHIYRILDHGENYDDLGKEPQQHDVECIPHPDNIFNDDDDQTNYRIGHHSNCESFLNSTSIVTMYDAMTLWHALVAFRPFIGDIRLVSDAL